jgi:hypothetical protein
VPFGFANVVRLFFKANFQQKIFSENPALLAHKSPFKGSECLIFRAGGLQNERQNFPGNPALAKPGLSRSFAA